MTTEMTKQEQQHLDGFETYTDEVEGEEEHTCVQIHESCQKYLAQAILCKCKGWAAVSGYTDRVPRRGNPRGMATTTTGSRREPSGCNARIAGDVSRITTATTTLGIGSRPLG
jgi:hypothetical protein